MGLSNAISLSEVSSDFSRAIKLVDEQGAAVILKNNRPRYMLLDFEPSSEDEVVSDEELIQTSKRIIAQNREAYEVLAQ